ncbi:MAG: hypothetical protein KatS3mg002_1597 [Candidatus Woesearchaeota archaeon]|nr:MAG: hypothetical protein KatS3mg002_1597 [Candidatus Woesearchaeota archaeon]
MINDIWPKNDLHIPIIYADSSKYDPDLSIKENYESIFLKSDRLKFKSKEELNSYINDLFFFPGQFRLNEATICINYNARIYNEYGRYNDLIESTFDYIEFWELEKEKCIKGVFLKDENTKRIWYFPGEYYMWLNFLPIFNKEKRTITFPDIRDVQLFYSLFRYIAELNNKHVVLVKKRQIASSYYHAAKLIQQLWFFSGVKLKLLSYNEHPGILGTWQYLEEYRDALNTNTGWIRHFNPDRKYNWIQKYEVIENGRKVQKGLKSEIMAKALSDNPTSGVSGANTIVFYEEAGLSPTLNDTYEFMRPSLKEGEILTGQFIAAGSVGDLEQCKALKKYIYNPELYDFAKMRHNMLDNNFTEYKETGCFIPQQWGMKPYIDEWGNSDVENAIDRLFENRKNWSNKLSADEYAKRVSQEPISLEEAFDYKRDSIFPVVKIKKRIKEINDNIYSSDKYKTVEIEYDTKGNIVIKNTNKPPIKEFPLSPTYAYKEGAIQVWEEPIKDLPFGTYIAGIDTVAIGKTEYSESLASIYVFRDEIHKHVTEIIYEDSTNSSVSRNNRLEIIPSSLVCCWTGRFDNIEDTHRQMLKILEWYNAIAVVEANQDNFIQYMIKNRKTKYLLRSNEFILFKEQDNRFKKTSNTYGWRNTGNFFREHMLPYLIQYMNEDSTSLATNEDDINAVISGIRRIKDEMLLKETLYFEEGYNTDRIIAATSAIVYMYILQANRGLIKQNEVVNKTNIKNVEDFKLWTYKKRVSYNKSFFNKLK